MAMASSASSTDTVYSKSMRQATAALCKNAGFDSIDHDALGLLVEMNICCKGLTLTVYCYLILYFGKFFGCPVEQGPKMP